MIIEQALYNYLSTYSGLTALVGTRIYPMQPPQNATTPYLVYGKVSSPRIRTYGTLQGSDARFDLTCTADTYLAAKNVRAQVQAALEGYSGVMGGGGGVTVVAAQQQNEVDIYTPETRLYHVVLDFEVWHNGG